MTRAADRAAELARRIWWWAAGAKRLTARARPDTLLGAALGPREGAGRGTGATRALPPALVDHVEGPGEVPKIFDLTNDFCPDTAHLAAAGGDPAATDPRPREAGFPYIHLKGFQREPLPSPRLTAAMCRRADLQAMRDGLCGLGLHRTRPRLGPRRRGAAEHGLPELAIAG